MVNLNLKYLDYIVGNVWEVCIIIVDLETVLISSAGCLQIT